MKTQTRREIPEQIEELMQDDELENMRNLDGWAIGTVIELDEDRNQVAEYENCWIELFNGEGQAGEFGGVKFMTVTDGTYKEEYAYASATPSIHHEPTFYVAEYDEPNNPDYGVPGPECGRP